MLPRPSLRRHRLHEEKTLHITAFLNLMVVLVPFLLLTAVFTRLTAIELDLSSPGSHGSARPVRTLNLIISVTEDGIYIFNDKSNIASIEKKDLSYDLTTLSKTLKSLKQQFPATTYGLILSKPSISYEVIVDIIDATREYFPDISLGEI